MGTKPVFKRYKNIVYLTCGIVIILSLLGCQHTALSRSTPTPTSIDRNAKKYLTATREWVLNKDFKEAADENQRILEYYSQISDINDMVLANYTQHAEIISELLIQIMEAQYRERTLSTVIEFSEEQIKVLALSGELLKKKAGALEEKIKAMEGVSGKVKTLETEKENLQQQIDQLKEIDLNPDPVGSKQTVE